MIRVTIKSAICGFLLGSILFAIAPLGLGIYFIEVLKPLLVPGALLTQFLLGNSGSAVTLTIALLLNGILYTLPFLWYFLSQTRTKT